MRTKNPISGGLVDAGAVQSMVGVCYCAKVGERAHTYS